jgi:hemerythrin superfamily protein
MSLTKKSSKPDSQNAITLLRADHQKVTDLFENFEKSRATAKKKVIAQEICKELTVHATIEEEIFYPAAKAALNDTEMVPEALVEHDGVKKLIAEIEGSVEGEMFEARVKVLSELIKHHVKEEQTELFPAVKKTSLDLTALGAQLVARKTELLEELRIPA